ncbi:hypothetical protein F2P81_001284 [Scophthalmus maximus]|uniref:Steroid 5-alpha reductase C-terminal domain-containing protein n=1 Tax=Scophthalmus maximus TaxID=52904 RepID=A0A6A4TYT4_SCOMX|nr:hypothetical protein F2P81_001284 [Scophthalmus maximus]
MDALLARLFSSDEQELYMLDRMAHVTVLMAACTFFTLLFENVPYGRYASSKYGFPVDVKFAWFVQELPAFLVPLCLVAWTTAAKTSLLPNQLLIAMYFCHYVQRSLIYPFLIRGGKATPFISFALAFVFCICNGYMQIRFCAVVGRLACECALRPHPEEPEKARRDRLQDSHRTALLQWKQDSDWSIAPQKYSVFITLCTSSKPLEDFSADLHILPDGT